MTVGIFSGREGVGKTTQLLRLAKAYPPVFWVMLELKDLRKLKKEESTDFTFVKGYKTNVKTRRVDAIETLNAIIKARDEILEKQPQTIVIDGISDLRDYATTAWAIKHNEETGEHRSSPKFGDWGAWGEINETVRDILEPLINFALEGKKNLWMTAQMKEDYKDNVKVGYVSDIKSWMSYPVQCLFRLERNNEGYTLFCDKEPENAAWSKENLEKDKGVLKELLKHDLVARTQQVEEAVAEQKEYMFRYGDGKKMFITAISKVRAQEEFINRTGGEIEKYEVIE